jgi:hypothetical protein
MIVMTRSVFDVGLSSIYTHAASTLAVHPPIGSSKKDFAVYLFFPKLTSIVCIDHSFLVIDPLLHLYPSLFSYVHALMDSLA